MKIVGLTGGIGSGKSTVARLLAERGARLIDADLLAREVVEPGRPAWEDIVREFGKEILNPDQSLNREKLAALVFADEQKRARLNQITHPRIGDEMLKRLQKFREEGAEVALIDAALLLESPGTNWIRPVIVVAADEQTRIQRVCKRDGVGEEEVRKRLRAQWSDEERAKRADFVIDNSGDLKALEKRVEEVWKKLRREAI